MSNLIQNIQSINGRCKKPGKLLTKSENTRSMCEDHEIKQTQVDKEMLLIRDFY